MKHFTSCTNQSGNMSEERGSPSCLSGILHVYRLTYKLKLTTCPLLGIFCFKYYYFTDFRKIKFDIDKFDVYALTLAAAMISTL